MDKSIHPNIPDFPYLKNSIYLDSACQTLRPEPVINAMSEYFREYNACGGRVKYDWGMKVDEKISEARTQVLSLLGKSSSQYVVAFTLNTSYGLNLVLTQIQAKFKKVITSEIEHNSVFLPTIEVAKRLAIPRMVLPRSPDGALEYKKDDLTGGIVVLNSMSNFDGRKLLNLKQIATDVHQTEGIVLIDAAQSMSHDLELLRSNDFDALFFSGHKFYGPSLGVIVIKKSLLLDLNVNLIGGGMVEDVEKDTYSLFSSEQDLPALLEIGLQNYSGIIGLNAAIDWLKKYKPENQNAREHENKLSRLLFEQLTNEPAINVINTSPTPIVSFYSEKVDAHSLAIYIASQGIMARSGYFCCHYYLKNLKQYPPLLRISLGLHNSQEQVQIFTKALKTILTNS